MPRIPDKKTIKKLEVAMRDLADEGFAAWGFIFDEKDARPPDLFSNHEDPIPLFIVKTEEALRVVRAVQPENFNLAEQEEAVANLLTDSLKTIPKGNMN